MLTTLSTLRTKKNVSSLKNLTTVSQMDKNELLAKQLDNPKKKARPVRDPAGVKVKYASTLNKLIKEIKKDINERLVPVLKQTQWQYAHDNDSTTVNDSYLDQIVMALRFLQDKWNSPQVRALAERVARDFVTTADTVNRNRFEKTVKTFGINLFGEAPDLNEYIEASIYDNVKLIQSIPERYLNQVESIVMTNVRAGTRSSKIIPQLTKQFGVTQKRAKMIARDQTAKLNGDLVEKRQRAVGFEYFQWIDSDDERVRDRHEDIANKVTQYGKGIYRWDNLPFSQDGRPIKPGSDYQCRCLARPVSQAEVDANIKAGRTNPGVKR